MNGKLFLKKLVELQSVIELQCPTSWLRTSKAVIHMKTVGTRNHINQL